MCRHRSMTLLSLVLLTMLLMAPVAHATKPCNPASDLAKADLIVLGQVVWKPFPFINVVRADRYYKGVGKQYFLAMYTGPHAWDDWKEQRTDRQWVLGFGQESAARTSGNCSFQVLPGDDLVAPLKPGIAPEPGVDLHLWLFWVYMAMIVGVVLLIVQKVRARLWRRQYKSM